MYQLPDKAWAPQKRGLELTIDAISRRNKDVCLYGPTGCGKTFMAEMGFHWAASMGMGGCFYVNRRLLIDQTYRRFMAGGLQCGIRAAGYEDLYDYSAPFQICSVDTERSRVLERKVWSIHKCGIVFVDEAHIARSVAMRAILDLHKANGASIVLLTATPIGLSKWADELIISGSLAEYRECKAIVPAIVRSIEQPDMRKVKREQTGEFVMNGRLRKIFTQSIVGNVIDRWKLYNPDARPTMLYAPGVSESIWMTEQFQKLGVSWCHIDANDAIIEGKRSKLTRPLWNEIQDRYRAGDIKGLSSRFRLREGVDQPSTYHCILACPIGSLASYLQTIGRALRYSPETPDHVIVTDHGGNFLRHGSPNHDRDWAAWWDLPERVVSEMHVNQIKEGKVEEPIRCPKCEGERLRGSTCPHCGFQHDKSQRHIKMEDGRLVVKEGKLIEPNKIIVRNDTEDRWKSCYFRAKNSKSGQTFKQARALFYRETGAYPPNNLPFMPKVSADWGRKVRDVQRRELL